jgi:hypothetical protein
MDLYKKCGIRIPLPNFIKDNIHQNSLVLTKLRKHQVELSFKNVLQITGVLSTKLLLRNIRNILIGRE